MLCQLLHVPQTSYLCQTMIYVCQAMYTYMHVILCSPESVTSLTPNDHLDLDLVFLTVEPVNVYMNPYHDYDHKSVFRHH